MHVGQGPECYRFSISVSSLLSSLLPSNRISDGRPWSGKVGASGGRVDDDAGQLLC